METIIRFGLGAGALAAGTAAQWFWTLVERGRAVHPEGDGVAAAIDRAVTVTVPAAAGSALGSALNALLQALERTVHAAVSTASDVERLVAARLARAGVPTRDEVDALASRLDAAIGAVDRLAAQPVAPDAPPPGPARAVARATRRPAATPGTRPRRRPGPSRRKR